MVPAPKQLALLVSAIAIGWACPDRAQAALAPGDAASPPGPVGGARPSSDWLRQFACGSIGGDETEGALAAYTAVAPTSTAVADPSTAPHRDEALPAAGSGGACASPNVDRVHADAVASAAVPSFDASGQHEPLPRQPPSPSEPSPTAIAVPARPSAHAAAAGPTLFLDGGDPQACADAGTADGSSPGGAAALSAADELTPSAPRDGFVPPGTGTVELSGATRSEILAWEMIVAGAASTTDDPGQVDAPGQARDVAPVDAASGSARSLQSPRQSAPRAAARVESGRFNVAAALVQAANHSDSPRAMPTVGEATTVSVAPGFPSDRLTSRAAPVLPGVAQVADAGTRDVVPTPAAATGHRRIVARCHDGTALDALEVYERAQRSVSGAACMSAGLAPPSLDADARTAGLRPSSDRGATQVVAIERDDWAASSPPPHVAAVAPARSAAVDRGTSASIPAATASDAAARATAPASAGRTTSDIVVADHASRVLMSLEALLTCDDDPRERFGAQTREVVVASHAEKVMRTLQDVLTQAKLRALEQRRSAMAASKRQMTESQAASMGCGSTVPGPSAAGRAPMAGPASASAPEAGDLRRDCQEASPASMSALVPPMGQPIVAGAAGATPPQSLRRPGCAADPTPLHAPTPAQGTPASPEVAVAAGRAPAPSADVATIGGRPALDEGDLDAVRGGFTTASGLKISFGIERAVYVNGNLVATTSLTVSELGRISGVRAVPDVVGADALMLIRNGAGNVTQLGDVGGAVGTIIQNTLNNQNISNVTVIDATVNSLRLSRGMDLHSTLRNAVTDALRR
ncbi:hypothetical protein [Azohydromonas sp.]|uniref:hypothetical protein n=1 Tax=Azohydromonas sp. TaxID=1872666 RepID=UPI002B6AE2B3|nr:hypothetical protein [Azohydromonas sp.]HMM86095.1 hypothetical protein [Azohydromonas sp.]